MKQLLCLLLVFAVVCSLTACGQKDRGEPDDRYDPEGESVPSNMLGGGGAMVGGWTAADDPTVTPELQAVFDKALDGLVGVDYTPLVYLGRQVVAGTNHAFLCQARVVYPDAVPSYKLVYVYEALDGSCQILSIADFDFGALCEYGG